MQIDVEIRELFDHLSCKTGINEYIDFGTEFVISLLAIDPLQEWGQETHNKSITEVIETSNAAAKKANQPKEEPQISQMRMGTER